MTKNNNIWQNFVESLDENNLNLLTNNEHSQRGYKPVPPPEGLPKAMGAEPADGDPRTIGDPGGEPPGPSAKGLIEEGGTGAGGAMGTGGARIGEEGREPEDPGGVARTAIGDIGEPGGRGPDDPGGVGRGEDAGGVRGTACGVGGLGGKFIGDPGAEGGDRGPLGGGGKGTEILGVEGAGGRSKEEGGACDDTRFGREGIAGAIGGDGALGADGAGGMDPGRDRGGGVPIGDPGGRRGGGGYLAGVGTS